MTNDPKLAAIALSEKFAATFHAESRVLLLAGSASRGQAKDTSDFDIVALYDELPSGASREMQTFEDRNFEVFAHDLGTLRYFCREVEWSSAQPVLATMIVEGVQVRSYDDGLLMNAKQFCREFLAAGPPPLDRSALDSCRFTITLVFVAYSSAGLGDKIGR